MTAEPTLKPERPFFSSGPTAKHKGWSAANLKTESLGRSHRSALGKSRLKYAIDLSKEMLGVPEDYLVGIMPASDTGALECAMWTMLRPDRPATVAAWESFGNVWIQDAVKQLKVPQLTVMDADYGEIPDLASIPQDNDVVFTWNGTTSGVRVASGDAIPADRAGLTICDATSAAFAQELPWDKLDVTTFSWQKVLGGEGGHGMLILSPRAVERLESYVPAWPLPKIFRMTKGGKLIEGIFVGETINTPSMLCVEDYIDALTWAQSVGGLKGLIARADANAGVLHRFVTDNSWIANLAKVEETRSNTSVCLVIADPEITALPADAQAAFAKAMVSRLDKEGVALDIGAYRDAPAGLRIWCGATVETSDLEALTPWLSWAFAQEKAALKQAA